MSQRYIYPPLTVDQIQAIYSNPLVESGYVTIKQKIAELNLLYDRSIKDNLKLPHSYDTIKIQPNELSSATSISVIVEKLQENFMYLNTHSVIASNDLPGNYTGYYTYNSSNMPIFRRNLESTPAQAPALINTGRLEIDPNQTKLDKISISEHLNSLKTGIWVRDNSLIDLTRLETGNENFQYGFLGSQDHITVVKMSSEPVDGATNFEYGSVLPTGSQGWTILDKYTSVTDIPSGKNKLKYNNIQTIKTDREKKLYVLDSGISRPGESVIPNESTDARRGVIYRYDISGYINVDTQNTITDKKRMFLNVLGDVNKSTNEADIIDPAAFTFTSDNNIVVYDNFDYSFKVFTPTGGYLKTYSKRNTFFRGSAGTKKQYLGVADISYDYDNDQLYVITPNGYLFIFDKNFKQLNMIVLDKRDSNISKNLTTGDTIHKFYQSGQPGSYQRETFKQIVQSENENNVYYILTNNRVFKLFKSRPGVGIGSFNLLDNNIGMKSQGGGSRSLAYRAVPQFLSIIQEANIVTKQYSNENNELITTIDTQRTYTYDQMFLYCDFVDLSSAIQTDFDTVNINFILSFEERENIKSCLIKQDYTIFDMYELTGINFREYTSDYVYNKLFFRLLSNHNRLISYFQYRLYGRYISTGELVYDRQIYLDEQEHRVLITNKHDDAFVGINEYYTSAVVNRCIGLVYKLQQKILKLLQTVEMNSYPPEQSDVVLEPYLYTNGKEYLDIDNKEYVGYFYERELPSGTIYVSGRYDADGETNLDGTPVSDRYLLPQQ